MRYGNLIFFKRSKANQVQDVHNGFVSRLGGLSLLLCFAYFAYIEFFEYLIILAFGLLFLFPALLEDLGFVIKPFIRLFLIFLGCLLAIIHLDQLPQFEFGSFNTLFNNSIFQIVFYTVAMTAVINGQNIIDGTNGLSGFSSLSIFCALWYLGFLLGDENLKLISITLIILLISFLLFNYPFGKIFLGDMGSYFLGFLSSYLVVKTFANYSELPSWSAVIILFYPVLEVIFSYFRKIIKRQSPMLPDKYHLHLKVFFMLSMSNNKSKKLNNALVAPFLAIIWLTPLTLLPFSVYFTHLSLLVLIVLIVVYIFFYYAIPSPTPEIKSDFIKSNHNLKK
jgi:UDP-GlcNAc:undecaprenyl-phosphate GlcNAc-1-phosphate transferase